MNDRSDLVRELPVGLQDDLSRELAGGEAVRVSLPGCMGEALVVTDRRVLILREGASGLNAVASVFTYPLAGVQSASAAPADTGAFFELRLANPPAEQDQARVYFPSSDLGIFEAAAELLSVRSRKAGAVPVGGQSPAAGQSGTTCDCGAAAGERDVFCAHCGRQVRSICAACGDSSPLDAEHCTHCGAELVDLDPQCPNCTGRVALWMSFCPGCGASLGMRCAACGGRIIADWKHCANCGRLLGSDSLDASAARSLQRRMQAMREVEQQNRQAVPGRTDEPDAGSEQTASSEAQRFNNRGQDFFDNDEFEDAVREFAEAVRLEPGNATYHCNLAVALDEAGRDEEALAEYQKTLALDPNDVTALLSLGYMYNEHDEPEKAQAAWKRILEVSPDSAEAEEVRDNLRHQGSL